MMNKNTFITPPKDSLAHTAGLYIHIPFCKKRCPYCAFYSTTDFNKSTAYLSACLAELKHITTLHADAGNHLTFDTIYIGGGTPSALPQEALSRFINEVLEIIDYSGVEFTIEFNPESTTAELLKTLEHTPISRASIGIQSLDDNILNLLGRVHDSKQAISAYHLMREILPNIEISLDMMYDIPNVPFNTIQDTVKQFTALSPEHISAYSYMPDTRYLTDASSENPFQMESVIKALASSGYNQYEVSNYCKDEYKAKHNSKYWQMKPYYGVGASAHSMVEYTKVISSYGGISNGHKTCITNRRSASYNRDTTCTQQRVTTPVSRVRYSNIDNIDEYILAPTKAHGIDILTDKEDIIKESVVFGLRMNGGVDLDDIELKYGQIDQSLLKSLEELQKSNLINISNGCVATTRKGLLLLDSIMEYLWVR